MPGRKSAAFRGWSAQTDRILKETRIAQPNLTVPKLATLFNEKMGVPENTFSKARVQDRLEIVGRDTVWTQEEKNCLWEFCMAERARLNTNLLFLVGVFAKCWMPIARHMHNQYPGKFWWTSNCREAYTIMLKGEKANDPRTALNNTEKGNKKVRKRVHGRASKEATTKDNDETDSEIESRSDGNIRQGEESGSNYEDDSQLDDDEDHQRENDEIEQSEDRDDDNQHENEDQETDEEEQPEIEREQEPENDGQELPESESEDTGQMDERADLLRYETIYCNEAALQAQLESELTDEVHLTESLPGINIVVNVPQDSSQWVPTGYMQQKFSSPLDWDQIFLAVPDAHPETVPMTIQYPDWIELSEHTGQHRTWPNTLLGQACMEVYWRRIEDARVNLLQQVSNKFPSRGLVVQEARYGIPGVVKDFEASEEGRVNQYCYWMDPAPPGCLDLEIHPHFQSNILGSIAAYHYWNGILNAIGQGFLCQLAWGVEPHEAPGDNNLPLGHTVVRYHDGGANPHEVELVNEPQLVSDDFLEEVSY
ncbi:MAG: hypothetical protein M1814_004041 [Vezdaea aestivalis]|nr:MAG: hypothetical protein M1814_004041 [Vezdaea aestivalis]